MQLILILISAALFRRRPILQKMPVLILRSVCVMPAIRKPANLMLQFIACAFSLVTNCRFSCSLVPAILDTFVSLQKRRGNPSRFQSVLVWIRRLKLPLALNHRQLRLDMMNCRQPVRSVIALSNSYSVLPSMNARSPMRNTSSKGKFCQISVSARIKIQIPEKPCQNFPAIAVLQTSLFRSSR